MNKNIKDLFFVLIYMNEFYLKSILMIIIFSLILVNQVKLVDFIY